MSSVEHRVPEDPPPLKTGTLLASRGEVAGTRIFCLLPLGPQFHTPSIHTLLNFARDAHACAEEELELNVGRAWCGENSSKTNPDR